MVLVDLVLSFLPMWCLVTLVKVRKHSVYTAIVCCATLILIGFDIIVSVMSSDFHDAAFILQLFLPAQLILAVISLLVGNLFLLIINRRARKRSQIEE
jgi:hypothetical protein